MHHSYQPVKLQACPPPISFSSFDDKDISAVHSSSHTSTSLPLNSIGFAKPPSKSIYTICDDFKEEDFQTVALDNNHWITDPAADRHLCIHEHSQPHSLHSYPCPYSLDSVFYNSDYTPTLYQRCWISVTFLTSRM